MVTEGMTSGGDAVTLTLASVAKVASRLKMYPYFDISNYILMCMMVRDDDRPTAGCIKYFIAIST